MSRYRHLMLNVVSLLPHCKKDNKVESNQAKERLSTSWLSFAICRKQKDLYLWMAKCPMGHLSNSCAYHGRAEAHWKSFEGSRPILTFTTNFNKDPHWMLLKEMITQVRPLYLRPPKDHRKSKPFHDHVFAFAIVDDHIWFRNYQMIMVLVLFPAFDSVLDIKWSKFQIVNQGGIEETTLVEVGPRFCLNPIKIFGGSFGGPTLYENPFYISPNQIRALEKKKKAGKYATKVKAKTRRKMHELENPLEPDEFADLWRE
ncbi:unnamed protein product [Spirodela intermedia]|uniref:Brix domain-containing protein n=1 Tax=Spirodela intermedia TaxID=51605 RepID=A0ABN7EC48_SPIIN|nr:unnamed protein product [Spirodela intermedia]